MPGPGGVPVSDEREDKPLPRPKTRLPDSRHVSDADAGVTAQAESGTLPSRRSASKDEEIKRLAAMAGHVEYDASRMEQKGMTPFACPACHRPLWVSRRDFGTAMTCEGCSLEINAPNPALGLPASLHNPAQAGPEASLPKAVLPTQRRVSDQPLEEGRPGGKTRKSAPAAPPARPVEETSTAPAPETAHPHRPKPAVMPKLEPIPAPADPVLRPEIAAKTALPAGKASQQRTVGKKAKRAPQSPPADEASEPPEEMPSPQEAAAGKGLIRLSDRKKSFLPKGEVEGDLEVTEAWGGGEVAHPVSRRITLISWLVLIPAVVGLGIWGMREVFRQKPEPERQQPSEPNNARIVHVAEELLGRFFAAKTLEERAQMVRHPDRTLPRMQRYYKRPLPTFAVDSFYGTKEGRLEDRDFLTGMLKLDGETMPRAIALEIPPSGSPDPDKLRIDWESYVYWAEVPWDEFRAQEMTSACDFRALIRKDDYYNGYFNDASRWVAYKIYHPAYHDKDYGYCYGYAPLNSPVCTAMIQPFRAAEERGGESIQGIVRLRFHAKSEGPRSYAPQVLIDKFTPDWVVVHEE